MQEEFDRQRQQLQSERQGLEEQRQQLQSEKQNFNEAADKLYKDRAEFDKSVGEFNQSVEEFNEAADKLYKDRAEFNQSVEDFDKDRGVFEQRVQQKFEKNFLEEYQIYRDHIKHEDTLANQRLSFFIGSQSFLFFPYFNVLKDYRNNGYIAYDTILLFVICSLGIFTSLIITPSIRGFVDASSAITRIWKKHYLNKYMELNLIYPKSYILQTQELKEITSVDLQEKNTPLGPKNIFSKQQLIGEKGNVSFLEIQGILDKNKVIPNIRYENNSTKINRAIRFWSNNVSIWFIVIWILALFVPVVFFRHVIPVPDGKFRENLDKNIIKNNHNLIMDIENDHNKKINTYIEEKEKLNKQVEGHEKTIKKLKEEVEKKDTQIKQLQSETSGQ